jgi:hypothetical protein
MWKSVDGNTHAKEVLAQYPSPRALRFAIMLEGPEPILHDVRSVRLSGDVTIGAVLDDPAFSERDIAWIHAGLVEAARDVDIWTATDGTQTVRTHSPYHATQPGAVPHRPTESAYVYQYQLAPDQQPQPPD